MLCRSAIRTGSRDELILALDLYLRVGHPGSSDAEVIELNDTLNKLPIHTVRPALERFRNPARVALKLMNIQALDPAYPGAGMTNVGREDAVVWDDLHENHVLAASLAAGIRAQLGHSDEVAIPEEYEDGAPEGCLLYRLHRTHERDRVLVARQKAAELTRGPG